VMPPAALAQAVLDPFAVLGRELSRLPMLEVDAYPSRVIAFGAFLTCNDVYALRILGQHMASELSDVIVPWKVNETCS
jgi:hypothetical protein